uniref:Lysosome-associated membrane glycoprotein 5 n=1 Tax=Biomphalaria glabrata TaxID=6526 RepID=A0A2C9KY32_BIOGL
MKIFILTFLIVAAQAIRFQVNAPKTNSSCLLLDINGSLEVKATDNVKNKTQSKTVVFGNATLDEVNSTCEVIKLTFNKLVEVWFQFNNTSNSEWIVTPGVQFNAKSFLDLENDTVSAFADSLPAFQQNNSYYCKAIVPYSFTPKEKFNSTYEIVAQLSGFQIQSYKNDSFEPAYECDQDKTSTTSTALTSTPTPATTTAPSYKDDLSCWDSKTNTTKFRLEATLALTINYEAKDGNKTKAATANIDVPSNVTANVSCSEDREESLKILFLPGWDLEYIFQRTKDNNTYFVSNIILTYSTSAFKDAAVNETLQVNYTSAKSNYLQAEKQSYYYSCKSNTSVSLGQNVTLYTSNLRYQAFNEKGNITFSGDATECSEDEETNSVVPIAVGAALAGLVVIVLIAYLIGRRRSRKSGYESV